MPFEIFRSELVDLIDNLLDILEQNSKFIFHLDGQTIILSDYLEIKPQNKEKLKKYIKSGNILIGPWYVLSDQFLSSAESTIRNLMYGSRDSKEFGSPMLVGYLPDQFGQIAQLPQIFKGFNIQNAILGRGIQDGIAEHNWYGLNGDSILAIALTHWYNNAQVIPEENTDKYLSNILEKQKKTSLSGHILLMNGCDHLFVQKNLPGVLEKIKSSKDYEIVHDSLQNAFNKIEDSKNPFPIYFGELRDDNNKQILSGTLSSRVYLKLQNYNTQTRIEKILEPLASISAILNKTKYPFEKLKYAWKLLIQNHAHDSICGCSIDDVHREMEVRYLKVNQLADKLLENIKNQKPETDSFLNLINLTSYERSDIVETIIDIPLGPISTDPGAKPLVEKEVHNFKLLDGENEVNFKILQQLELENFVLSRYEVPLLQAVKRFKIILPVSMKPFSGKAYKIMPAEGKEDKNILPIGNFNLKLEFQKNGTFNALLKNNNKQFKNLHLLTIEDDLGDEYNFESGSDIGLLKIENWSIEIIEENILRKRTLLKGAIEDFEVSTEVISYSNTNRIDFKTKINNKLKNKRIRLHFPTSIGTNFITADTPFGIIERARPSIDWKKSASNQPLYNFIHHKNEKLGLSFFGGGLASYELYKDGNGFAVDLIRAVGRLSSVHSHSHLETPEAQCNRLIEFNYSIYLQEDSHEDMQKEQLKYQVPVFSFESKTKMEFAQLIDIAPDVVLSSFKRSEYNENLYIIRLFNPSNRSINTRLGLNFPFKKVFLLNLNEEIEKTYDSKKQLNLDIGQHQIITVGIEI